LKTSNPSRPAHGQHRKASITARQPHTQLNTEAQEPRASSSEAIVTAVRESGVSVAVNGGELLFVPTSALTEALRRLVEANKLQIHLYLVTHEHMGHQGHAPAHDSGPDCIANPAGVPRYVQKRLFAVSDYMAADATTITDEPVVLTIPEVPGIPEMKIWRPERSISRAAASFMNLLLARGTEEHANGAWWIYAFTCRLVVHGRLRDIGKDGQSLSMQVRSPFSSRPESGTNQRTTE
jgi:hypothetical protein